ncbi:MAG: inorganic phosphate transporter [Candidatus Methanofastidiosia archaeon]
MANFIDFMIDWFWALGALEKTIVCSALVFGFYMAWTIGANDVANSMGTSVGSGALTLKKAVIVAGIFEFAGAVLVGKHVSATIKSGIVSPAMIQDPSIYTLAMLACLISAAVWVFIATYYSLPVSTTQAIVGSVIGIGLLFSYKFVNFGVVENIALSWILSPILGAILSFVFFRTITRLVFSKHDPLIALRNIGPFLVFANIFFIVLSIFYKGLAKIGLAFNGIQAVEISIIIGSVFAFASYYVFATERFTKVRTDKEKFKQVEHVFAYLQIMTACSVAFAHGTNDVANAIGPLAAIFNTMEMGLIDPTSAVPVYILLLGGVGIVFGIATWGYRVIETVGKKITEITPSRGFCAEFGTTLTVLLCSKMGLPISTTQVLVGSVMGVGFARGITAIDFGIIKKIFVSWILTLPISAVSSMIIYLLLKGILL